MLQGTLYLIAEEELQTIRGKNGGMEEKKKHFVKLTQRNENHVSTSPVFKHDDTY